MSWVGVARSSWLSRARWDEDPERPGVGVMLVEAKAGYVIELRDVPADAWQGFLAAPSRGSYYHNVLARYPKRVVS